MRRLYNDAKETNQTVAVIHTAFEDKPSTVGLVHTKEGMSLIEKLEYTIVGHRTSWTVGH